MQLDNNKILCVDVSDFYDEDESNNYKLQVNGYNGTAENLLNYHNEQSRIKKDGGFQSSLKSLKDSAPY